MAEQSTQPDLDLVSTEDLIEALRKRFDCFVLLAEWDRGPGDTHWRRHWDGSFSRALGMMSRARRFWLKCGN